MTGFFKGLAISAAGTLIAAGSASAGPTFLFDANQSYTSASDSPFLQGGSASGGTFQLENFESGGLSVGGFTLNKGSIKGPSGGTDSVDADTGAINGSGVGGHSWKSGNSKAIVIKFTEPGAVVTMAGLALTDSKPNATITFKAWDTAGNLLGKIKYKLNGNALPNGATAGDRFFGLINEEGISKIKIQSNKKNFEIDHVQFGYGFAVMPVPAPLALGFAGLLGAAFLRRQFIRKAK